MTRDEYMQAFRAGLPVSANGVRYRRISAVILRRTGDNEVRRGMPPAYITLELEDVHGNSITMTLPAEVSLADEEIAAAHMDAKNTRTEDVEAKSERTIRDSGKSGCGKKTTAPFAPPTAEEVAAYCAERGRGVDPQRWYDHYTANGWMVGRTKMKDWRAAVRTWENMQFGGKPAAKEHTATAGGSSFDTEVFFRAALANTYGGN